MDSRLNIPKELLGELTREVIDRSGKAGPEILYAAGLAFGETQIDRLRLSGETPAALFARALALWGEWGFGAVSRAPDSGMPTDIELLQGPATAWAPLPDGAAQCHILRGVLAGFAQRVLYAPADVVETACAAAGAPKCHFALKVSAVAREESWGW